MGDINIIRGPELGQFEGSFGNLLYSSLKNGGSKIAMVDAITGEDISYQEILQKTVGLAQYLKKYGLKQNDTISICTENNVHFCIPVISSMYLGITVAPLNNAYIPRELVHAMNISNPKIAFCSASTLDNVMTASEEVKSVEKIIVLNKCDVDLPRHVLRMSSLFDLTEPDSFEVTPVELDHVAAILCSSGTTGLPKGVMLTHRNYHCIFKYFGLPKYFAFNANKVGLGLLPFYHCYGFACLLGMIILHMKIVILARFHETIFLDTIQTYKVTTAFIVPPIVHFLGKSPLIHNYDLSSLTQVASAASPLTKDVIEAVIKRLNISNIIQGYGLTESTLAVCVQPPDVIKFGTVGLLVPGVECKVRDMETNKALGPNQRGELCFRGACVMKGYMGNPKATAETIDSDGWLHTGDVGYYDQDGFLFIVDRIKELIKFKGFQVPPAELEAILLQHPGVKDCAVVGKPDDDAGELPVAFVVRQPNATITESDVIEHVARNVSYHKRLHGGVIFVEAIPKNPTGKILRKNLREKLKEAFEL